LITDSFHKDQWDYFYQMKKDGAIIEKRRVKKLLEGLN
jgi:outer membrane protein assembly factor BamE